VRQYNKTGDGNERGTYMSDNKPAYKRVLLKISGEALAGDKKTGLDFDVVRSVCQAIKTCVDLEVEIGVVVGGGNFWRGVQHSAGNIERTRADHMGMMATVMNCLAMADMLEQMDVPVRVQTALSITAVAEPYIRLRADSHLKKGRVVIFGCGTGLPYFSTDTAAVLRAAEIHADILLLAKNIDGVYTADPKLDPNAIKIDSISYEEVLSQRLKVVDLTATSLSMDNKMPIILFALHDPTNIVRAVMGENIGTRVG
jgi:uridylate kinase